MNNLSTNGGEYFAYANTADGSTGSRVILVSGGASLLEKGEAGQPIVYQWKDQSECCGVKYLKYQEKWLLAVLTTKGCQILNSNASRQMAYFDSKKKVAEGKINLFTAVAVCVEKTSGSEMIAVGTSSGEIY
jgi:hypothetical protein